MKKSIVMIMVMALLAVMTPMNVFAKAPDLSNYESETLAEVFAQEGIEFDFSSSNYSDTGGTRATVYLFRQNGCLNCKDFLNFVKNTLLTECGDRFKVISFELRDHPNNFNLLNQLAAFYGVKSSTYTTPFIIINDEVYQGPIDAEKQERIKLNIYGRNGYDVMEEMDKGITNIGDSDKRSFRDPDSGVSLYSRSIDLLRRHQLKATPIDLSHLKMEDYEYWKAYDIDLYDGDQIVPLESGEFGICIPVTSETRRTYYKIAYVENDSIEETFDGIREMGAVCFDTPHLSQYAVFIDKQDDASADKVEETIKPDHNPKKQESEPNPYTADPLFTYVGLLGIGIMILFGGMVVYFENKEQN